MRIARVELLRLSTYVLACVGSVSLYLAEEEGILPYGWIVVIAAVLAYALCDYRGLIRVPDQLDGLLATLVLGLLVFDAGIRQQPIAQALGHVLVLLQVLLFFHRKTVRTYLLMAGISLPQMAIGAIVNNQFYYGVLLAVYVVLSAVVLAQLHALFVVSAAQRQEALQEPVRLALLSRLSLIGLLTGVVGVGSFLLIPRQGRPNWSSLEFTSGENLTGFDEEVTLGDLGTILKNDNEVMSVQLTDQNGNPYTPPDEPLWRGITLTHYENGKWSAPQQTRTGRPLPHPEELPKDRPLIVQEITLQPIRTDFCFAFWPPLYGWARGGGTINFNSYGNALLQEERVELTPFDYVVVSPMGADLGKIGFPMTRAERRPEIWNSLVGLSRELRQELSQYIEENIAPLEELRSLPVQQRCERLTDYLRATGGFTYTLDQQVVDPNVDPVIDFLRNRKAGHCEYFASALALMLRTLDVPTRIVNGFKGADISQVVTRFYVVRQMHAHSWVEAAVPDPQARPTGYRWIVLDPTPGGARRQQVAQIAAQRGFWKRFRDAARQIWSRYILNFDFSEQQELIYQPMRELVATTVGGLQQWAERLRRGDGQAWVTLTVTLLASGLSLTGFVWFVRRRRRRDVTRPRRGRRAPARYYLLVRRFLRLARRLGVRRQPADTMLEVAVRVQQALSERGLDADRCGVPVELVRQLYLLRFRPGTNGEVTERASRLLAELRELARRPHAAS